MGFIGGTAKAMPDGTDGCKRYRMTKKDGSIFYAKTYDRDSIDGQTLDSDSGWEQIGDAGGKHCYQFGKPFTSDPQSYTKTALDLTKEEPKVVGLPTVQTLTLTETIALAGAALNLKANPATSTTLDECTQAVLGYSIRLMNA